MSELDLLIETPSEPGIKAPRASFLSSPPTCSQALPTDFPNISIVSLIYYAKFPVYLAKCKDSSKHYALKLFFSEEKIVQTFFHNESRFSSFDHPNVIKIAHIGGTKTMVHNNIPKYFAFIIMEYAPYGDLHNFVAKNRDTLSEKLVRTLFRQLIEGLEYLHSSQIAHMDLKLENILLGDNLQLKIADFDLAHCSEDAQVLSKGSKFFRAPELIISQCTNPFAADVYSAGIILFALKCGGVAAHTEDIQWKKINFFDLLNHKNSEFWAKHCEMQQKSSSFFSSEFKELFNGMTKLHPKDRWTISQVKASNWYKGPILTQKEAEDALKVLLA